MKKTILISGFLCAAIFSAACGGSANENTSQQRNAAMSPENINSTNKTAAAETPQTPLEKELARLQRANFRQIIAFSRKDGGKLSPEDIDYFKQYAPSEQINQRLRTDDDKYIVAGTNFVFTPEQLDALQKRFAVENFTEKYGRKPEANANTQR